MEEKPKNKAVTAIIAVLGSAMIAAGFIPMWSLCSGSCSPGIYINPGLIAFGISVLAFLGLSRSKFNIEAKGGCSLMLLGILGPMTFLGAVFSGNAVLLLSYFIPAIVLGIILVVVGFSKYNKSIK